jgi:hypothetical protein
MALITLLNFIDIVAGKHQVDVAGGKPAVGDVLVTDKIVIEESADGGVFFAAS